MATSDALHLHPLSFAVSAETLPTLNSVQLALVAFHPDAIPSLVNRARIIWHKRRAAALERGEQQIHSMAPALAAATASKRPPRAIPPQFNRLVDVLSLAHERGESRPLRAKVGGMLKEGRPDLYEEGGMPRDFRAYCSEAERLGIVQLNPVQLNGRDWIALTDEFTPPSLETSAAPAGPPLDAFHLFSLSFPLDLENMAVLSSAQLLAVQFRDDIPDEATDSRGLTVADRVEGIFWKRRSLALGSGQKWEDSLRPIALTTHPTSPPLAQPTLKSKDHLPLAARDLEAQSNYEPIVAYRAPSPPHRHFASTPVYPPLPSLYTPLPATLATSFFVLHLTRLPPNAIDSIASIHALLPHHLVPVAAILYAPSISSTDPTPSRRAHLAYRSFDKRIGAMDAVNTVLVRGPTGESWKIRGEAATTKLPTWEWGDVRKDLREVVWREVCEKEGVEVAATPAPTTALDKRPREATSPSLSLDAQSDENAKRRRTSSTTAFSVPPAPSHSSSGHGGSSTNTFSAYSPHYSTLAPPTADLAEDPSSLPRPNELTPDGIVPSSVVESLYELYVSFGNQPRDLNSHRPRDDLFIGRFGAVGWTLRNVPGKYNFHIIFPTELQRELAEEWMLNANRYWKNNDMFVDRERTRPTPSFWLWSNFTAAYRRKHGIMGIKEGTIRGPSDEWGRPTIVGSTTGKDIPHFAFEKTDYWQGLLKHSRELREKGQKEPASVPSRRARSPSDLAQSLHRDSPAAKSTRGRSRSPPVRRPRSPPAAPPLRQRSLSPHRAAGAHASIASPATTSALPQEKAAYVRRAGPSELHLAPFQVPPPAADSLHGGNDGPKSPAAVILSSGSEGSDESEESIDGNSSARRPSEPDLEGPLLAGAINKSDTVPTKSLLDSPSAAAVPRPATPSIDSQLAGPSSASLYEITSVHSGDPVSPDLSAPISSPSSAVAKANASSQPATPRGGLLSRLAAAGNNFLDRVGNSPDRSLEKEE